MSVIITIDSEYNDETYENKAQYVGVYDGKGHEIHPLPGKEKEARHKLKQAVTSDDFIRDTDEPLDDVVLRIKSPELYVKE